MNARRIHDCEHSLIFDIIPKDMQDIPIEKADGRIIEIQGCIIKSSIQNQ